MKYRHKFLFTIILCSLFVLSGVQINFEKSSGNNNFMSFNTTVYAYTQKYIESLNKGDCVSFSGYNWRVVDSKNRLLVMESSYGSYRWDWYGNLYEPYTSTNIAYELNTTFFNSLQNKDMIDIYSWDMDNSFGGYTNNSSSCYIGLLTKAKLSSMAAYLNITRNVWTSSYYQNSFTMFYSMSPTMQESLQSVRNYCSVMPVIHLIPKIGITSGTGTASSPYKLSNRMVEIDSVSSSKYTGAGTASVGGFPAYTRITGKPNSITFGYSGGEGNLGATFDMSNYPSGDYMLSFETTSPKVYYAFYFDKLTGKFSDVVGYFSSVAENELFVNGSSGWLQNTVVTETLKLYAFNSKPSIIPIKPTPNETFYEGCLPISPSVKVSDADGEPLKVSYSVDGGNAIETKILVSGTQTTQTVAFSPYQYGNLPVGTHTMTFTANDGTTTSTATVNFTVKNPIYSINSNAIKSISLRKSADKYFIYLGDGQGNNVASTFENYFSFGTLNKDFLTFLLINNFSNYAVTPTTNYDYILAESGIQDITLRKLISSSTKEGILYNTGELQNCLDNIKSKYTSNLSSMVQYVIANEDSVAYNKTYSDYENDPKYSERFMYKHDPTIFENNQGYIDFTNKWIDSPLTTYNNVGKYVMTYQAEDDPTARNILFAPYKKWSTQTEQLTLYVHRRPIALFSTLLSNGINCSVTDKSYDLDHLSHSNKGIVNIKYKWMKMDEFIWRDGIPPTVLDPNKTYYLSQIVQDEEGAWSYPYTTEITTGKNNAPIADFSLNKYSMNEGEVNNITDQSFDTDNDPIAEWHWWILDSTSNVVQDCGGTKPDLKILPKNDYKIMLQVKDNPKIPPALWSEPCVKDLTVNDALTLSATVSPNPSKQGQKIILNINTSGYAKYLTVYFPTEIYSLDSDNLPITRTITEEQIHNEKIEYYLPLQTPITISPSGSQLKQQYVINVKAEKANGMWKMVPVQLDVQNSILNGLKTEIK